MTTVATLILDYANPKNIQLTLNFHDFFINVVVSFQSYNCFISGNLIGQEHVMNFHNLKKLSGLADFHPFYKNLLQQNLSQIFFILEK